MKIGIQGVLGSFCLQAAKKFFGDNSNIEWVYLINSHSVCEALSKGTIDQGIIAIENSIGGVVKETKLAMEKHPCHVADEISIAIKQCLLTKGPLAIEKITEIHSHPQALKQCEKFLEKYTPTATKIPEEDTAICADRLSLGLWPSSAAVIANEACAELYTLHLLEKSIQDNADNKTRFIIIAP